MRTEKWSPAYNKKGNNQHRLQDGSWVNYMKGLYDDRDLMSDCVRPSWSCSGEYRIEIMPATARHNSDAVFVVITNKEWGNKIAYNINADMFKCLEDLIEALRKLGGVFRSGNGREYMELM